MAGMHNPHNTFRPPAPPREKKEDCHPGCSLLLQSVWSPASTCARVFSSPWHPAQSHTRLCSSSPQSPLALLPAGDSQPHSAIRWVIAACPWSTRSLLCRTHTGCIHITTAFVHWERRAKRRNGMSRSQAHLRGQWLILTGKQLQEALCVLLAMCHQSQHLLAEWQPLRQQWWPWGMQQFPIGVRSPCLIFAWRTSCEGRGRIHVASVNNSAP